MAIDVWGQEILDSAWEKEKPMSREEEWINSRGRTYPPRVFKEDAVFQFRTRYKIFANGSIFPRGHKTVIDEKTGEPVIDEETGKPKEVWDKTAKTISWHKDDTIYADELNGGVIVVIPPMIHRISKEDYHTLINSDVLKNCLNRRKSAKKPMSYYRAWQLLNNQGEFRENDSKKTKAQLMAEAEKIAGDTGNAVRSQMEQGGNDQQA